MDEEKILLQNKENKRLKNTRLIRGIKVYLFVGISLCIFLPLLIYFIWGVSSLIDILLIIGFLIFCISTILLGIKTFNPKPFEIIISNEGVTFIDRKLNERYVPWENIERIEKVMFEKQGMKLCGIVLKKYEKEEKDGNKIMLGGDVGKDIIKEIQRGYAVYKNRIK